MRPKYYFVLRLVSTITIGFLTLIVSVFVVSFVLFSVHESGEAFLLGFGKQGILTFISLFPWALVVVDIALVVFLEWLLRGFKFGYRFSLLAIFIGIFLLSIVLGVIVNFTPLHQTLLGEADRGALPFGNDVYESLRDSHANQGIFRGTITSINGNQIVITHNDGDFDADDGTRTITLPSTNSLSFKINDRVYVFGTSTDKTVGAYGIKKLSPEQ